MPAAITQPSFSNGTVQVLRAVSAAQAWMRCGCLSIRAANVTGLVCVSNWEGRGGDAGDDAPMESIIEFCIKPGRSCSGCLFRGSAVCKFIALSQVTEFIDRIFRLGGIRGDGVHIGGRRRASPLAEETWSNGRASASNNVLCVYIPSWGLISMRGNWQLVPTMDVVAPRTRTMKDMLEVLDAIVADDEQAVVTSGVCVPGWISPPRRVCALIRIWNWVSGKATKHSPASLPNRCDGIVGDVSTFPDVVKVRGRRPVTDIPLLREGISGLVRTRNGWMPSAWMLLFSLPLPTWSLRLGPRAAGADDGWREGIWVGTAIWYCVNWEFRR